MGDIVISCGIEIVDAHTLSYKLDTVFEKLKGEAELNVAFDFVLMNLENRTGVVGITMHTKTKL